MNATKKKGGNDQTDTKEDDGHQTDTNEDEEDRQIEQKADKALLADKTVQSEDLFFLSELAEILNYFLNCLKEVDMIESNTIDAVDDLEKELLMLNSPIASSKKTSAPENSCDNLVSNQYLNYSNDSNNNIGPNALENLPTFNN